MTIVELFVFLAAAVAIYFLMRPLQKRLERYFLKFFKARSRGASSVIDITDYSKKDKNK